MIISENRKPSLAEFSSLMLATDNLLNSEAVKKQDYYANRNGSKLEEDVFNALTKCASDTPFEDTIHLVSGASFPDIVASKYYGVEVKSTNKDHWKSIGSSILESTRIQDVERIFLTFGKLGKPVSFLSRPYEECLSGISVTHYPRYQIDMQLQKGETIFDKMGISYDQLRKMENPVTLVSKYYKSQLKPGESLWWAADSEIEKTSTSPIIRLWSTLTAEQKNFYTVQGYALFPEILGSSTLKYQRFALWLVTHCSVVNTNIRDQFSAGGKVVITINDNIFEDMPAAYGRIQKNSEIIAKTILAASEEVLRESWCVDKIATNRIAQWCRLTANYSENSTQTYRMLCLLYDL